MEYSAVPENLQNLKICLYAPHQGVGGAEVHLPTDIKQIIDEMAEVQDWGGPKPLSLKEAFDRLQSAVGDRGKVTLNFLPDLQQFGGEFFKRGYFNLEITEEKDVSPKDIVMGGKRYAAVSDDDGKYRIKHCWCLIRFVS